MLLWEKKAFLEGASLIIGVDEAGRGPLAGPVVAGAVSLRQSPLRRFSMPHYRERVDDSKLISPGQRERTFREILKKSITATGTKDHRFIDDKNILNATISAMKDAVKALVRAYCRSNNKKETGIRQGICILVDGNINLDLPYRIVKIIKGDSRSLSIAAASIVAKVTRDRIMRSYDERYPQYGFLRHKGYGTRFHFDAIRRYGPCRIHRKSFAPMRQG